MKDLLNHKGKLGLLALGVLLVLATVAMQTTAAQPLISAAMENGETTSVVVSPETGGELISPDGRVTITFPPGLFSETTVVTYTETAIALLPPTLVSIGPSFTLQAARLSDGQPVVLLEMDACPGVDGEPANKSECGILPEGGMEIVIHYSDIDVERAGVSESELTLSYFYTLDGQIGKWLPLETAVDENRNLVTASTRYFARFVLVGISRPPTVFSALSQVEVVVDDQDTGFARFQAGQCADPPDRCWWHYWSASGAYNGHSYYTKNSTDYYGRENWGEWTPNIPQSGRYEILAFIPWNHATTRSAHYHTTGMAVRSARRRSTSWKSTLTGSAWVPTICRPGRVRRSTWTI